MIKALGRRGMRMLLTATALLAGAAGVALATIPGSGGVINGCYEKRTGLLRVIDTEPPASKTCTQWETPISWNQKGEQGIQGIQGEKGDKGDPGTPGKDGAPGAPGADGRDGRDGVSVTSQALAAGDANCANGGSKFTAANGVTYACNGTQGPPGSGGGDITAVRTASGSGLEGGTESGDATLRIEPRFKLPQFCASGNVPKWSGLEWSCAPDNDHTYSGANFALSSQSCTSGQFARGVSPSGSLQCQAEQTYSGANFALSNQSCASGQFARGISNTGALQCQADEVPEKTTNAYGARSASDPLGNFVAIQGANDPVSYTPIATLDLPSAGTYMIVGKVNVRNGNAAIIGDNRRSVRCWLQAWGMTDYNVLRLEGGDLSVVSSHTIVVQTGSSTSASITCVVISATSPTTVFAGNASISALRV